MRPFFFILRKGFGVRAQNGTSVTDFLRRDMGISEEILEQRIQTLFLNGKALDDPALSLLYDGASLALSSAMPGVAGATLRKGGAYAPMRAAISLDGPGDGDGESGHAPKDGRVRVKLFNMMARELGPFFWKKGIFISGPDLADALGGAEADRMEFFLDGEEITVRDLIEKIKNEPRALFRARISG